MTAAGVPTALGTSPAAAQPALAQPAPAQPAPALLAEGPVFNDPLGTDTQKYAIRERILQLTASAVPGSSIKVAIYHVWDQPVIDALIAAHQRGVRVQILLDSTNKSDPKGTPAYNQLLAALGSNAAAGSFVRLCPTGKSCLGDPQFGASIMHNKFFLFSQVEGASNVVVQTTSNMTPGAFTRFNNDALVLPDNPTLHTAYSNYFRDLLAANWQAWRYRTVGTDPYKAYYFPRTGTTNSTDTIDAILNNVQCTYQDANGVTQRTKVRVGIFKITRKVIADKLTTLQKAGCTVDVVYAEADSARSQNGTPGTWDALHATGGPSVRCYNDPRNPNDPSKPLSTPYIIHSKYLLVDGMYFGARDKLTFTGSHNYTGPSLRENDETLVKIDDDSVHDAYAAGFTRIKTAAYPGTSDGTDLCMGVKPLPQDPETT
ncbi:hypothetical protein G5C51_25015 [Streptomyces sp. A7024]|uniref:phospholipase D n=1 Tax=Streptomyces coryli TaxID=1128680 RepID=A0A6G4U620_9ACTN|nr:phospholipase D-like domain-containing protein [Streptomyces coryli]NGN67156.1 hypothetical protein [Streptomyces coryli]